MSQFPPLPGFNRQLLFRLFFFGVFLFLIYQFVKLLTPFFGAIMGAVTLAVIFYPLHVNVQRRLRNANAAAGTSTALILLAFIIPVLILAWLVLRETAVML